MLVYYFCAKRSAVRRESELETRLLEPADAEAGSPVRRGTGRLWLGQFCCAVSAAHALLDALRAEQLREEPQRLLVHRRRQLDAQVKQLREHRDALDRLARALRPEALLPRSHFRAGGLRTPAFVYAPGLLAPGRSGALRAAPCRPAGRNPAKS